MVKLLIGHDGSECSADAIDDLCRAGLPSDDVEALVLSVADVYPGVPATDYPILYPHAAAQARVQVDEAMREAECFANAGRARVKSLFLGWDVRAQVVAESPYWGLVTKAEQWQADLLVVGSHGRSALARWVLGTVSQNAALYADCSVRIGRCRADQRSSAAPVAATRSAEAGIRIVVGWDGSPDAEVAVRALSRRRWPNGSRVRLVTALHSHLVTRLPTGTEEFVQRARNVADGLRAIGLLVEDPLLRDGDPKRVLLNEANDWQADCIFVGAKGLSRIGRVLLGSVSSAIASRARCTVEVVRSRHPA